MLGTEQFEYAEMEAGRRRISALQLKEACDFFRVKVGWFYEGLQIARGRASATKQAVVIGHAANDD